MGCCVTRDEKMLKDKCAIVIDFNKKYSFNNESNRNRVVEQSPNFARNFFQKKSSSHLDIPGIIVSDQTVTVSNSNFQMAESNRIRNEENEKRNREEEKKDETKELSFRNVREKTIIPYPRIEMSIVNSRFTIPSSETITITPNSLNGVMKKLGDKFVFGRHVGTSNIASSMMASLPTFLSSTSLNRPNDYDFTDETIGPRQFEISYVKEKNKFFIVDNKKGTGLFVKIKQSVVVDHDMIISFCASHMILQVEPESKPNNLSLVYNPDNKILKVRFLQGPHQNQEKSFNSRDKKIVRIGRSKQAEVVYKDDSVSRIQCTIVFEKGNWNLYDGYLDNGNKGSTNGLWLLASNKIEITNDMVLKTGNTGLLVKLTEHP